MQIKALKKDAGASFFKILRKAEITSSQTVRRNAC